MMPWRALLLTSVLVAEVSAQQRVRSPGHVVSGVVFDSIGKAPLAGAVVQMAQVDSAATSDAQPRIFWGVADTTGRYEISGVPSGHFAIGFQHAALNALGLESPVRAVVLSVAVGVTIDLAIPSGPAVNAQLCGSVARDKHDGMVVGYVFDARGQRTLSGAVVLVHWLEVALDKGDFHTVPHRSTAPVDEQGRYVACGVATEAPVGIRVSLPGYRTVLGEVAVPDGSVARQDFRLADSGTTRGTATLTGRVVHTDGSPIATGRAAIADLALEVPVKNGQFTMSALPAGTWEIEALAIGYEPHSLLVDVLEKSTASVTITISKRARMLDAVTVIGKPSGDLKVLEDVARRSRTSFGSVFLQGNSAMRAALTPTDVLKAARGFSLVSPDSVLARGCRFPPSSRRLAVYVDGLRFQSGIEELRNAVPMRELLAVEAYPDLTSTPIQWRTEDACAVIAVWTKR